MHQLTWLNGIHLSLHYSWWLEIIRRTLRQLHTCDVWAIKKTEPRMLIWVKDIKSRADLGPLNRWLTTKRRHKKDNQWLFNRRLHFFFATRWNFYLAESTTNNQHRVSFPWKVLEGTDESKLNWSIKNVSNARANVWLMPDWGANLTLRNRFDSILFIASSNVFAFWLTLWDFVIDRPNKLRNLDFN